MKLPNFIWQDRERFYSLVLGRKQKEYLQIIISLEKNQGNLELIEYHKGKPFYQYRIIDSKASLQRLLDYQLEQGKRQGIEYQVIDLQEQGHLDQQLHFLAKYLEEFNRDNGSC